ncbi:MAG: T9SS type A sorting domain-containing protein [Bacteroidia bacterium]
MRTTLLTIFICVCAILNAQIPNSGFEDWSAVSIPQLEDWNSLGNVELTTDATDGTKAIKLVNDSALGTFGGITNTDLNDEFTGGQPYTDIPLTMSFSCKYDLAPGDIGKIYAVFKAQGVALGVVDFTINGNSADTFVRFNYAVQWTTQINPDTLIVVMASTDIENPNVNGNGYVIIDDITFRNFGTEKDSVDNNSFENWGSIDIEHPNSWFTTDLFLKEEFNLPIVLNSVTKATNPHSGNGAIKLRNVDVDGDLIPGIAVTGDGLSSLTTPSFAVNQRWKHIHGLYWFDQDSTDVANVTATFFLNGALIGAAQVDFTEDHLDDYKYFSGEIQYFSAGIPDSASIIIATGNIENPVGTNTTLWVDDLSFTNHTLTIEEIERSELKVFPNPCLDVLNISSHNAQESILYTLDGREVIRTTDSLLNLREIESGTYYLQVWGKDSLLSNQKIIKL